MAGASAGHTAKKSSGRHKIGRINPVTLKALKSGRKRVSVKRGSPTQLKLI